MKKKSQFLKNYGSLLAILAGIAVGSLLGIVLKDRAVVLKPFGDVFLNLLLTAVVPMVFFSMASAVAPMKDLTRLGKIFGWMIVIFIATGVVASVFMVLVVKLFLPLDGVFQFTLGSAPLAPNGNVGDMIVRAFTAPDFSDILSKKNMLALIVYSLLVGLSTSLTREKGEAFRQFLISGNEVMGKLIGLIMLYAPIGLGAYFAYLVGVFGPQLLGTYGRAMAVYYPAALAYFVIAFTVYAWIAGRKRGVTSFWSNILPASLTAWGTGSSVATIPSNLAAAERTGVPADIREVVIPVGATIHMEGSCLAAVLKVAILFAVFHIPFAGVGTLAGVLGVTLLAGVVVSGVPGGGLLGEILIITMYGLPIEALPLITMVGTLVDPPATMVNAIGDNVSSMLVARVLNGPKWMNRTAASAADVTVKNS